MSGSESAYWRKCSTCKAPIAYGADYLVCNVSTCNRKRAGMVFCKLSCWEVHVPVMNHRESWAEERKAPKFAKPESSPESRYDRSASSNSAGGSNDDADDEILVVASKVKDYIRQQSDFNTSASSFVVLSNYVRSLADRAAKKAQAEHRDTVFDRDIAACAPRKSTATGSTIIRRRPS